MDIRRVAKALLIVGIVIADWGALSVLYYDNPKPAVYVLAGLAAATMGGIGVLATSQKDRASHESSK